MKIQKHLPMLQTAIIDDEKYWRDSLAEYLANYCSQEVSIAGVADSLESGIQLIESMRPDLLFLDVRLYDKTAFDLLDALHFLPPAIIIITGFDKDYVIDALHYHACDYLTKPIELVRLKQSLKKAFEKIEAQPAKTQTELPILPLPRSNGKGFEVLQLDQILYIEADQGMLLIHLTGKEVRKTVAYQLKFLETNLPSNRFARIHNSFIINLMYWKSYTPNGKMGEVELAGGAVLPVSSTYRRKLLDRLPDPFK